MGRLAHLLPGAANVDGVSRNLHEAIVMLSSLSDELKTTATADGMGGAVNGAIDRITRLLSETRTAASKDAQAISKALSNLESSMKALNRSTETNLSTKVSDVTKSVDRLVEAVQSVRIPEPEKVDLTFLEEAQVSLMSALESVPQERPMKWKFDVQRDHNNLIESVIATAI